jgi:predicted unusual protein kinase regulating ubiquinone biosynthesis (AarF/ABC1/UbiB family)
LVEAKLNSIIAQSGEKISNILVEKSLGSATVGEAFLCRLFGPEYDITGKLVVIKLLRPDIKVRFDSEKPTLKSIAKSIDNTVGTDKKGQAERLLDDKIITTEQEMDFTIEEKNCETGKVYNDQIPAVLEKSTVVLIGKCRTSSKKTKHLRSPPVIPGPAPRSRQPCP